MRRFAVELLRESPSPALRSCAALAQVYHPLARELFNAAFVSCYQVRPAASLCWRCRGLCDWCHLGFCFCRCRMYSGCRL